MDQIRSQPDKRTPKRPSVSVKHHIKPSPPIQDLMQQSPQRSPLKNLVDQDSLYVVKQISSIYFSVQNGKLSHDSGLAIFIRICQNYLHFQYWVPIAKNKIGRNLISNGLFALLFVYFNLKGNETKQKQTLAMFSKRIKCFRIQFFNSFNAFDKLSTIRIDFPWKLTQFKEAENQSLLTIQSRLILHQSSSELSTSSAIDDIQQSATIDQVQQPKLSNALNKRIQTDQQKIDPKSFIFKVVQIIEQDVNQHGLFALIRVDKDIKQQIGHDTALIYVGNQQGAKRKRRLSQCKRQVEEDKAYCQSKYGRDLPILKRPKLLKQYLRGR